MLHRRVAYAAALAAALLFQIFFKGWFSAFLLALVVLFPVLALALSLPAILSCALELSPCVPAVERGGAAPLHRRDAGRELQGAGKNGRQAQGQGQNRKKDHQGKQERGEPALEKDLEQQGGSQGGGVSDTSVQHGGLT